MWWKCLLSAVGGFIVGAYIMNEINMHGLQEAHEAIAKCNETIEMQKQENDKTIKLAEEAKEACQQRLDQAKRLEKNAIETVKKMLKE